MKERIGFIGLGIMGGPMATNLLNAGHALSVYDIRLEALEGLVERGATSCCSAAEASTDVDVVITMLPDSPDVEAAYLGPRGVLEEQHRARFWST